MIKKQRSSKHNGKDDRPICLHSLQERLKNININVVDRTRYHEQTDLNGTDHLVRSSHFHQLLEQVFQYFIYLFKYLWHIMLKDLDSLYELYSKFLFNTVR